MFFYLGETDTWAEFEFIVSSYYKSDEYKAIFNEYKRIGPKPAELWHRAHAPDGTFAPDGDATSKFKSKFVKSIIQFDG